MHPVLSQLGRFCGRWGARPSSMALVRPDSTVHPGRPPNTTDIQTTPIPGFPMALSAARRRTAIMLASLTLVGGTATGASQSQPEPPRPRSSRATST